jgi:hypothetical protein
MPDIITKSAAAATEFRRLQQQEQVAKETEQVNNQFMAHALSPTVIKTVP